MCKAYVVITERGREKGRITGSVLKIEETVIHVTDLSYSEGMNRGIRTETVSALVKNGEFPSDCLESDGYINYDRLKELGVNIVMIEGKGLNFYSSMP